MPEKINNEQISLFDLAESSCALNIINLINLAMPTYLQKHIKINYKMSQSKSTTKLDSITVSANPSAYRTFGGEPVLLCNIKTSGKIKYVRFRKNDLSAFQNVNVPKTIESNGLFFRIPLNLFEAAIKDVGTFSTVFEEIIFNNLSGDRFDCCSRYQKCSKEKHCVHPDIIMGLGCSYHKKLKQGYVFFKE